MPIPAALVSAAELAALRAAVEAAQPAYLADLERLVNIDCGSYTKAGVDEVGALDRRPAARPGRDGRRRSPTTSGSGDTVIADARGRRPRRPDAAVHRPHGHRVRPGHRGRAPVHDRGRHRDRARRHRHEERPARRPVRDRRAARRPRRASRSRAWCSSPTPTRRSARRPRRPHIRAPRRRRRRVPRPRVRPRQRRHRLVAQGQPRTRRSRSTAAPRTPASSPRRAAARSSRRRGS